MFHMRVTDEELRKHFAEKAAAYQRKSIACQNEMIQLRKDAEGKALGWSALQLESHDRALRRKDASIDRYHKLHQRFKFMAEHVPMLGQNLTLEDVELLELIPGDQRLANP